MENLGWGIVGFGEQVQKRVLPAFKKSKTIKLVSICFSSEERASQALSELKDVKGYGKLSEFLEDPELEVVYICTPHHLHVPQAFKSIEAGKNVLLEKPLAQSVDGARKLIESAKQHGVKLGVAYPLRHHPGFRKLKEEISSGSIGEILIFNVELTRSKIPQKPWWKDQFHCGPLSLMDLGIQAIDLICWLKSVRIKEVFALSNASKEDNLATMLTIGLAFEDKAQGAISVSNLISASPNQVFIRGTKKTVIVEFNWPEKDSSFRFRYLEGDKEDEFLSEPVDLYFLELESFNQAVLGKAGFSPEGEEGYSVVETTCAVIESIKDSRLVKVGEVQRVAGLRYKES